MLEKVARPIGIVLKVLQAVVPLLARLLIGQAFAQTGWGKLHKIEDIISFFSGLGIPAPAANAYFVSTLELVGGVAILLGLGTRAFAFLLCGTMVVALGTADREALLGALQVGSETGLIDVVPLAYMSQLLWLVAFGPGVVSLDALIKRLATRRSAAA